jgi:hypothetical protein
MDENEMFSAKNQMDRETLRSFEQGVSTKVVRDIVGDHLGKPVAFPTTPSETPGHTNFSEPLPLGPPPGIKIMDEMLAQDDRIWRRDLAQRLGVKAPNDEPQNRRF